MVENATGLILRTRPLTETSLIVHWLTPQSGRLATVAKGARRPASPFQGKLDLFYEADFSYSRSRRSELHTLREASLRQTHPLLRRELACLQQAAYAAALIEQTTETETPLPGIFLLMAGLLGHLTADTAQPQTLFSFELKLLGELGLQPNLEQCRLNPGTRQLARAFSQSDWPLIARVKPSAAQVSELNRFLRGFLISTIERIPAARETALQGAWPEAVSPPGGTSGNE